MTAETPRRRIILGHIGLFYAAVIWGATFFLVKGALADIDPLMMVGYRFLLAGGIMAVIVLASGRNLVAHLREAVLLSVILWFLYVPQTVGLNYTTASNSGFITGLFVAFVPLFLKLIFRRNPTLMEVLASFVSLSGLWVLTGGLRDLNVGDLLTLVAAMTYALHVLYSDKYMRQGFDPWVISCQQFLLVGFGSLVVGLLTGRPIGVESMSAAWVVVFLALFPTASAFVIQMVAQRIIQPMRVSLIFAFEPVFAGIFAWTIGGEELVFHRAMGGLIIFLALVISALPTPAILRPRPAPLPGEELVGKK